MAIHADIMAVQRTNHSNGADIVPLSFHQKQKLPGPAQESRDFFNAIFAKASKIVAKEDDSMSGGGATPKQFVRAGGHRDAKGRVMPSRTFMLKPYYEDFDGWSNTFNYPTAGWAEIATQALMHAGGLGHMSQRVHSHVPEVDQRRNIKGASPVLAVEIEPGMHRIGYAVDRNGPNAETDGSDWGESGHFGKVKVSDHIKGEAAKLAALDFLINNQDRHELNLLFRPNETKEGPEMGDLLAIDNGRSFHYNSPNRFYSDAGRGSDHLFNYMHAPGYSMFGLREGKNLRNVMTSISDWWKKNGHGVRTEMNKQLKGIKHRRFADHIETNFNARADALDKFVKTFKKRGHLAYSNRGANKQAYADLKVPVGGHDPDDKWVSYPSDAYDDDNMSDSIVPVESEPMIPAKKGKKGKKAPALCPSCGECLTCWPTHPVGVAPTPLTPLGFPDSDNKKVPVTPPAAKHKGK